MRNDFSPEKINIEKRLQEGDAVIFYGSIAHGVEKVDPKEKLSWKSNKGRWFIGMFVNDSDHVKNRMTAKDLAKAKIKVIKGTKLDNQNKIQPNRGMHKRARA